ncbi:MAG: tRNA (adenosine(37)-N6)-threonylcarbamoyltransferase complex dimerization subunit type 1 TsaB [Candidatus Kapaibacteriota bacterium]
MDKILILSLETSSNICSVAISEGENCLLEYAIHTQNSHDQFLAVLVKRALQDVQIETEAISHVAVSSGPGSFTGLRIGAAFAKGFCFDNKVKLVPVPTLTAMALVASDLVSRYESRLICILHSHRNFFFYQFFDMSLNPLSLVAFDSEDKIQDLIQDTDIVIGTGIELIDRGIKFKIPNIVSASNIARLGYKLILENKTIPAEDFTPSYFLEFQPKTTK